MNESLKHTAYYCMCIGLMKESWLIAHRVGNQYCVLQCYQDQSFLPESCYFKHMDILHHALPYSALHQAFDECHS